VKKYKYVIISSDGSSRDLASDEDYPWGSALVRLLEDGWQPVRECAMGAGKFYLPSHLADENSEGADNAYALVLLLKDA